MIRIKTQPTEFLLLKAYTSSEWDDCDFIIIKRNDLEISSMQSRLKAVRALGNDEKFYAQVYWVDDVHYYVHMPEDEDELRIFLDQDDCTQCFIELAADDLEQFTLPSNPLCAHQLVLKAEGTAYFKAYGKHTGEAFWSATFDLRAWVAGTGA